MSRLIIYEKKETPTLVGGESYFGSRSSLTECRLGDEGCLVRCYLFSLLFLLVSLLGILHALENVKRSLHGGNALDEEGFAVAVAEGAATTRARNTSCA